MKVGIAFSLWVCQSLWWEAPYIPTSIHHLNWGSWVEANSDSVILTGTTSQEQV